MADLPTSLLHQAHLSGNSHAWRPEHFLDLLDAAARLGISCVSCQFQFRLPCGGTCDMYWLDAVALSPNIGERWQDYVDRSAAHIRGEFQRLMATTDFRNEARDFQYLREKMIFEDFDPIPYLYVEANFDANKGGMK